ncbi:hypothetical protein BIX37_15900 [Salmonella enterica]|nr:hypothetical protein [Salmonella enterica]EBR0641874.1 hypothetical protein [Salmonella enterica]
MSSYPECENHTIHKIQIVHIIHFIHIVFIIQYLHTHTLISRSDPISGGSGSFYRSRRVAA